MVKNKGEKLLVCGAGFSKELLINASIINRGLEIVKYTGCKIQSLIKESWWLSINRIIELGAMIYIIKLKRFIVKVIIVCLSLIL